MAGARSTEASRVHVQPGLALAEAVAGVIRQVKEQDPMAPATVAVHSSWAGLSLRRLLASGGLGPLTGDRPGLVNVSFITIARVAELLGAPTLAAAGRRPLPAAVRTEAVRAALQAEPGLFSHASRHPSTVLSLDRTYDELRRCPAELLDRLAATSRRSAEVVRICGAARDRLSAWYDETDLAEAAAAVLEAPESPAALSEIGHLVTAGLEPLPPALGRIVTAFQTRQDPTIPTVIESGERAPTDPAAQATAVVTCPDPDEEVRAVVRRIGGELDGGMPLHRMAVLYPHDSYAQILHQQLAGAGIPFNGPGIRRLADTPAGAALTGLLEMAEGGLGRDEVMNWMASGPILDVDSKPVPSTTWDRISKRAGVVAGVGQWDQRLEAFATAAEERAAGYENDADDAGGEWKSTAARRDAALARSLRAFALELAARVTDGLPGLAPWSAWCAWAGSALERYLGGVFSHGRWPDTEQDAFVSVTEAIEGLASLDELGQPADVSAFRSAVGQALESPAGRVGRFGEGVMVGSLGQGRGLHLDAVWVVGLSEGYLPSGGSGGGVLLEDDRQAALANGPTTQDGRTLDTRHSRRDRAASALQAALASASRHRTLSWSRAELRSARPHLPSRWLLEAARSLTGAEWIGLEELGQLNADDGDSRFSETVSFAAGLAAAASEGRVASLHDRDVAQLSEWVNGRGGRLEHHPVVSATPAAAYAASADERRAGFSRFAGKIDPSRLVLNRRHSATKLETWAACPFRWFLGEALRLSHEEPPEDLDQISPRDKGLLVHEILEHYVLAVIEGAPRSQATMSPIAERFFAEYEEKGLTGKPLLWSYDREVIRRELDRFLREDTLHPVAAELSFGRDTGDDPPVEIEANGETIRFSGVADRVDRDGVGLVVTDYKTGGSDSYRGLNADPVMGGTKLQLHIYARAARRSLGAEGEPVRARYWCVSEKGDFREFSVDLDTTAERFHETLDVITAGIKAGHFPARPGEDGFFGYQNCGFCDFKNVCPTDRDRRWEAASSDPALAAYRAMAEPEPVETPPRTAKKATRKTKAKS